MIWSLFNNYLKFKIDYGWSHVKEIPNTNFLVSLHHSSTKRANLEIFDLSRAKAERIYSFEEVLGGNKLLPTYNWNAKLLNDNINALVTGDGDLTYNVRRSMLGAIPLAGKTTYHLFKIETGSLRSENIVTLYRKSKWYQEFSELKGNFFL